VRLIADDTLVACTLWGEARGETPEGRIAVAEVIRNRMAQHYQSDGTVAGTLMKPHQFSCWSTRDPSRRLMVMLDTEDALVLDCFEAWERALAGSNLVRGALLYANLAVTGGVPPDWGIVHRVATIGNHSFYRPGAA
jgi:spore germination cell wall hydrolase CwlJ-like protein